MIPGWPHSVSAPWSRTTHPRLLVRAVDEILGYADPRRGSHSPGFGAYEEDGGIRGAGPVRDRAYRRGTLFESPAWSAGEFVVTARAAVSCPARSCMTPSEPPTP